MWLHFPGQAVLDSHGGAGYAGQHLSTILVAFASFSSAQEPHAGSWWLLVLAGISAPQSQTACDRLAVHFMPYLPAGLPGLFAQLR